MVRITNSMMMRRYGSNIAMNTAQLDKKGLQVSTFRRYQRGSEEPMSALKAMQVRRSLSEMNQVTRNLDVAEHWLAQSETAAMAIKDCVDRAILLTIQGRNDPLAEEDRLIIAHQLKSIQEELLQALNTQVAGKYLFGDANTKGIRLDDTGSQIPIQPPFTILMGFEGDEGEFNPDHLGRSGILENINPDLDPREPSTWWYNKFEYVIDPVTSDLVLSDTPVREKLWIYTDEMPLYYNNLNLYDEDNMEEIYDRIKPVYFDLGLGLRLDDNGAPYSHTVFNLYTSGVELIGAGNNNLYNLIGELADAFKDGDMQAIDGYIAEVDHSNPSLSKDNLRGGIFQRLQDAQLKVLIGITTIGEHSNFVSYLQDRNRDSIFLAEEMQNKLEIIQPDEAIMNFKMQEVVYQACLQMGNYILQPSLMSYLK